LSGSGDKVLADSAVFNSAGTALLTGTGRLLAYGYGDFATWNNLAGAFFNVSSDGEVFANIYGRSLIFNNLAAARFAKTAGANSTVDSTILNNNGELGCDSGTLTFNMVLNLNTGGTFTGIGNQVLGGGTVTLTGTSTVLSPVLSLAGASLIGGTGATLATAGGSLVDWSGGSLSGTLATAIGSKIRLSGSGSKGMADGAVLNNAGTVVFAGSGPLLANAYAAGATINNQPSGVIQALTNSTLGSIYGAGCFLTNAGSILLSSTPDLFQADWNYVQTSSGTMALVVAGTTAGTTYSRFAANSVTLDGSLAITLANGFSPTNGQSFDIATYGSESGQFALRHLPALPSNLAWQITYGATAVTLNVVRATTITDATRLANGHFQFSLSGPSATSALIQASTNLVNWTSLQTNTPFTGLLLFDDAQAVGYRVRFYRVIMQP
jgi:hypothetical protein